MNQFFRMNLLNRFIYCRLSAFYQYSFKRASTMINVFARELGAFFRLGKAIALVFSFVFIDSDLYAQNTSFQRTIEEIVRRHAFECTSDWKEWRELKMLRDNFPSMAPHYEERMRAIEARYDFSANFSASSNNPNHAQAITRRMSQHMTGSFPPTAEQIRAGAEASARQKQLHALAALLSELSHIEPRYQADFLQSPEFLEAVRPFHTTFARLKDMQEGKLPFSLKDAFYIYESAYGHGYLSYEEYTKVLNESVAFIRQWAKENGYDLHQTEAAHYCIQRFMRDTLYIHRPVKKKHLPFFYDYTDYAGTQDVRNLHVTKTLATGTGQCHTLPVVYSLLAEGLNVPCYISYAPYHSFIKYPDHTGIIRNYEPTTHWPLTDQWYSDHLYIKTGAVRSKIYLDTLNPKMIVAACLLDLALGYRTRVGVADGAFMTECIDYAMRYFPGEANIQGQMLRVIIAATRLERLLSANKITDIGRVDEVPGARDLLNQIEAVDRRIEELGYQDVPEEAYQALVREHEEKKLIQSSNNIDSKTKRNLFVPN